ncbi:hypothetical protein AURDEDRAFT_128901 [Auricularia subglabra TFB-10046 SS5]|nr:hypothetical protein AURDEDRAFT_128901 [Auricularia subglabra TFB-10046 SS5]
MADVYCFICGTNALVALRLVTAIEVAYAHSRPDAPLPPPDTPFHFAPDDVRWQEDLCLVGPLGDSANELFSPYDAAPAAVQAIDAATVRALRPMVPGEHHIYATVTHRESKRDYPVNGNVYPFFHEGCMRIFATVLHRSRADFVHPERALWAIVRRQNLYSPNVSGIDGVEYGLEIDLTQAGYEWTNPLANVQDWMAWQGNQENTLPPAVVRCLERGHYPPSVIHDWWCGCAAMFIFARPDRYPIFEAFSHTFALTSLPPSAAATSQLERLPTELLATIVECFSTLAGLGTFLVVSKTIRQRCLAFLNTSIRALAPDWMAPPPRVLKALNIARSPPFPWLQYAHYCTTVSTSMRNRARIFGLCEQLVKLAESLTAEELGQVAGVGDQSVRPVATLEGWSG